MLPLLKLLGVITTHIIVYGLGGVELNPLMRALLDTNIMVAYAVPVATIALVSFMLYYSWLMVTTDRSLRGWQRSALKSAIAVAYIAVLVFLLHPVMHNVGVILQA